LPERLRIANRLCSYATRVKKVSNRSTKNIETAQIKMLKAQLAKAMKS
jgi:hypothetical protein